MTDVVIPAHNEEDTIGAVVHAARFAPTTTSVIVVCDNCTDTTADRAHAAGADVVLIVKAGDKGTAMACGLAQVATDDVMFIDADLVGLVWQHVEALHLAEPVRGMVCGLRDEAWHPKSDRLPPITGERRLPAKVARAVDLAGSGYRAETLINAEVGRQGLAHRNVVLIGVHNPTRVTSDPLGWAVMWADLAVLALVNIRGLVAYARGGNVS